MLTIHLKRDKYGREEVHKYLYPNVHILTPRCVFSVKQFPFIKRELCEQAGVTVFLNAESSFTGDPHFSKVFVKESKRYGLFR